MPKVSKEKAKSRNWVLTCNNYTDENVAAFDLLVTIYKIRAYEIAPTTGTPHIQGYAYFNNAVRRSSLQKKLPRFVLIQASGSPEQNQTYCKKEGKFTETGLLPKQGIRNDIHSFVLLAKSAPKRLDEGSLLEDHSQMVAKYPMFVDRVLRHYHPPKPLTQLNNWWYYGPPGTGKTTAAAALGSHYVKQPNKWFCGYAGEDALIIEDIQPNHSSFMGYNLKIWADKAPFTAQVKCSSMYIRPKQVIVTSNYTIDQMGWDEITTKAIKRRFTEKLFEHIF